MRIVVGEHNRDVNAQLRSILAGDGHTVSFALDGVETLWLIQSERPDLIIIDWMLPVTGGLQVCKKVRASPDISTTPIIMLVDDSPLIEEIKELNVPVNDYLSKPVNPEKLLSLVRSTQSRSTALSSGRILMMGPIKLDPDRWTVTVDDNPVELTVKEFRLLQELLEAGGRVVPREALLERVWGYRQELDLNTRTIDVHIGRLRGKLGSAGRLIRTVRNIGYRIET